MLLIAHVAFMMNDKKYNLENKKIWKNEHPQRISTEAQMNEWIIGIEIRLNEQKWFSTHLLL